MRWGRIFNCRSFRAAQTARNLASVRVTRDLGRGPSPRLGMTERGARGHFDKIRKGASLVALTREEVNLAGEFRLVRTAQDHATKSVKEISRFRRAGGPKEGL